MEWKCASVWKHALMLDSSHSRQIQSVQLIFSILYALSQSSQQSPGQLSSSAGSVLPGG